MSTTPPTQLSEQLTQRIAEKVAAKHDLPLEAARAMVLDVLDSGRVESPYGDVVAPIVVETFKPITDAIVVWGESMRRAVLRFSQSVTTALKTNRSLHPPIVRLSDPPDAPYPRR